MVNDTGVVMYNPEVVQRNGRRTKASSKMKRKRVDYITIELCVILIRTKVVVKDTPQL